MWRKYDSLTGVLVYEMDPVLEREVPQEEIDSWKKAHNLYGAVANSCIKKILFAMMPSETFAEASARLGYCNTDNEETRKWYYDRGILVVKGEEDCIACSRG